MTIAMKEVLKVKKLSLHAQLPIKGSKLAAGYDLFRFLHLHTVYGEEAVNYSAVDTVIPAEGKQIVATDISIAVPEGTYGRVAPRSGLAAKHHLDVGAGVIDADYRGPVGVVMFNFGKQDYIVKTGDRIAQLILEKIVMADIAETEDLDNTERGSEGFGSTGVGAKQ